MKRWVSHARRLESGRHVTTALLDAWLLDGPGAFSFVVLERCPIETLREREQSWIDAFPEPFNSSRYAVGPSLDPRVAAKIAESLRGQPLTEERKRKISRTHRTMKRTPGQLATLSSSTGRQ